MENQKQAVYIVNYTTCYKLRHDMRVYDKGCEDFEKDLYYLELVEEEKEGVNYV